MRREEDELVSFTHGDGDGGILQYTRLKVARGRRKIHATFGAVGSFLLFHRGVASAMMRMQTLFPLSRRVTLRRRGVSLLMARQ